MTQNTTPKQDNWNWKSRKPNNLIPIPTTLDKDFFKLWCIFLRPLIKLTERETDVVASFLRHRFELSKSISDPALLDMMVMSDEIRKRVLEECHMTLQHFYVVLASLKKNHIIVNGVLNPKLIPNTRPDDNGTFQLLILFKDTQKNDL